MLLAQFVKAAGGELGNFDDGVHLPGVPEVGRFGSGDLVDLAAPLGDVAVGDAVGLEQLFRCYVDERALTVDGDAQGNLLVLDVLNGLGPGFGVHEELERIDGVHHRDEAEIVELATLERGFALDGLEGQDVGRQRELDFAPAGHDLIGAVLAGFGGHADIGHTPPQGFAHAF